MRRILTGLLLLFCSLGAFAKSSPQGEQLSPAMAQTVDRICAREHEFLTALKSYSPLAETYFQELRPDKKLGYVPLRDHYYMAQLDLRKGLHEQSFLKQPFSFKPFMAPFNVRKAKPPRLHSEADRDETFRH